VKVSLLRMLVTVCVCVNDAGGVVSEGIIAAAADAGDCVC